ncbi:MAG: hypothetical protein QCH35_03235 [Methanomicrobiaceae archaeon]|nr:hypothetical protein [Methanomicrobiaceae archaeon]
MVFGPIQMIVIGFTEPEFYASILRKLRVIRERRIIRLIDLLFIRKDAEGTISELDARELSEEAAMPYATLIGDLLGLGDRVRKVCPGGPGSAQCPDIQHDFGLSATEIRTIVHTIPPESAAALILIEHVWAARLMEGLRDVGGILLAQGLVVPESLLMLESKFLTALDIAEQKEEERENSLILPIGI